MGLNESFLTGSRIADGVREVRPEGNALRGGSLVLAFPRITERHGGRSVQVHWHRFLWRSLRLVC